MPGRGLEPPRLAAYDPKSYVYTNFTIPALNKIALNHTCIPKTKSQAFLISPPGRIQKGIIALKTIESQFITIWKVQLLKL